MTLLWMDGFNNYGSSEIQDELARKYDTATGTLISNTGRLNVTSSNKRFASIGFSQSTDELVVDISNTSPSTIITGFAINKSSDSPGKIEPFFELASTTTPHLSLTFDDQHRIGVYLDGTLTDTNLIAKSNKSVRQNRWHFIEIKATIDNSIGSVEIHLDGVQVIDESSIDTRGSGDANVQTVKFTSENGKSYDLDDLYILDNVGTNSDFLGEIMEETLIPTQIISGVWDQEPMGGGGNHVKVQDLIGPDDDTTYVYSDDNSEDLYSLSKSSSLRYVDSVTGIELHYVLRRDGGTRDKFVPLVRPLATIYDQAISGSFTSSWDHYGVILENNPETGMAWVDTIVDALVFGGRTET